jgi:hypothetical protein
MAVLYFRPRPHERVRIPRPRPHRRIQRRRRRLRAAGYGHYIENIGNEDVELLIALNNGTYESISLADWIGANPHLLLATNFEVPENTFKDFQTRNRFLVG